MYSASSANAFEHSDEGFVDTVQNETILINIIHKQIMGWLNWTDAHADLAFYCSHIV